MSILWDAMHKWIYKFNNVTAFCSTFLIACDEIDPVENATLTEIILPEGAVRWTELDVSLTYTCKDNFHWLGSTAITRKCTEDGWTNYVASCLPG